MTDEQVFLWATALASLSSGHPPVGSAPAAMALPGEPIPDPKAHLERCWRRECDIDPMILRMRLLRHQGSLPQAHCLEQELMPLF